MSLQWLETAILRRNIKEGAETVHFVQSSVLSCPRLACSRKQNTDLFKKWNKSIVKWGSSG